MLVNCHNSSGSFALILFGNIPPVDHPIRPRESVLQSEKWQSLSIRASLYWLLKLYF